MTPPPIPINKATPYVSTIEPWVAEGAATAAAHELALYEEKIRKIREAEEAAAAAAAAARAGFEAASVYSWENIPQPEGDVGYSESSFTIGDPISCKARAYEPQFLEEEARTTHPLEAVGSFTCAHALPKVTWFEVCLMEGGTNRVGCKSEKVGGSVEREVYIQIECKEGIQYMTMVWLWQVGDPAHTKTSKYAKCEEDLAEALEGHWL